MTDPITRARKEWCESPEPANYPASRLQRYTAPCPPEVVAALLDLVAHEQTRAAWCPLCGTEKSEGHSKECHLHRIDSAITRALEGKGDDE